MNNFKSMKSITFPQRSQAKVSQRKTRTRSNSDNLESSQFRVPYSVAFPLSIIGFPDRLETTLRYSENYSFSASPTPAAQRWAVNSAFDPNVSGVGHQPSYFDTFSGIYARYYVEAFQLEIYVTNHTTTCATYVVLGYGDQDISGNSVEQLAEAKYTKLSVLAFSSAGGSAKRMVLPWMTQRQLMGSPDTEPDDNMYATTSASPNDVAWGWLKMAADDGTTNISAVARVVLHQRVVFKDLLPQVSS